MSVQLKKHEKEENGLAPKDVLPASDKSSKKAKDDNSNHKNDPNDNDDWVAAITRLLLIVLFGALLFPDLIVWLVWLLIFICFLVFLHSTKK